MQATLLGLDVGTTAAKAVLFDLDGHELTHAERNYPLITPQPGWAELDPRAIWSAVQNVLTKVTAQQPENTIIAAVGLSTQGGTLIPADADGNPVYNAITWLDQRAAPIISEWQSQGIDRWIRQISGWSPQPGLPLASLCALKRQQPEVYSRIRHVFSVNDFIIHQMTGVPFTNPSMAGEMLLMNCKLGQYDQDLCELAGIHPGMLSPIQPSDAFCAPIKPDLCRQLGLPIDTVLINGGQDHACEALALGMLDPGDALLACGTAWVINTVTDTPVIDNLPLQVAVNPHVVPDRWIASQYLGGFGAGFAWWLDQISGVQTPGTDCFTAFDSVLSSNHREDSGVLYFPVSGTPRSGLSAGGFWGLRLDHTREDLGRAILESAAFELSLALDNLAHQDGPGEGLWMVGGAARSTIWPQILADANQISILLTQYRHGPALGAAILAGSALGLLTDPPRWVTSQTIHPQPAKAMLYQQKRAHYLAQSEKFTE